MMELLYKLRCCKKDFNLNPIEVAICAYVQATGVDPKLFKPFKRDDYHRLTEELLLDNEIIESSIKGLIEKGFLKWYRNKLKIESTLGTYIHLGCSMGNLEVVQKQWEKERELENRREEKRLKKEKHLSRKGFVYLMRNNRNYRIKIGFSTNPKFRERTLQSQEPEVELIWQRKGTIRDEKTLHTKYDEFRLRGEWFALEDKHIQEIIKGVTHKEFNT